MATIGHRLAVANAESCRALQWQSGIMIHHLSQYSRRGRATAASEFRLGREPAVLALAAGGPAESAGLRTDDSLIAADGAAFPAARAHAQNSFAPTERMIDALEAAFADGRAELRIRRDGSERRLTITAQRGCASRFQLIPSPRFDAKADGRYVQLTSAMVGYAQGDEELAALVAHELAHNILQHRVRLNQAGVDRGAGANHGRSAQLFRQTELEADRLAIYLMHRAGYDPRAAVRLWTRQSSGPMAEHGGTHPAWPSRIAAMNAEIAAIAAAEARGQAPRPPFTESSVGVKVPAPS